MADRVANQRKPKAGSRENKPLAFPAAVNWDRMFATPDERAALDAASAALDRAAEALAALVSPKAFKAKLADLGRGRAKRGRPPGRTGELWFIRFLLEATGDVEGARLDTAEVNKAAVECLLAVKRRSATHAAGYMRSAQKERERLKAEYAAMADERERLLRTICALSALETLDWAPHERKPIQIFLAPFGAPD